MSVPDGWRGLLARDEKILWQGRPEPGFRLDLSQPKLILMGVFFMGFSLFWMIMASQAGGFFWMFGLLFFGIGFFNAIGIHFWKSYLRGKTHYTLTNKQAFIATDLFDKKRLKSYPINPDTNLEFIDTNPPSILFASARKRSKNTPFQVPAGFELIPDARDVMQLIRNGQRGQT